MTTLEIYNLALSLHDKSVTLADLSKDPLSKEVMLCGTFLRVSQLRALREYPWSFFVSTLPIDYDDDVPGFGYGHGYALPRNLLRHVPFGDEEFRIVAGRYYTNHRNTVLYGMLDDCIETMDHPADFDMLVAYALSYELCGLLSPRAGLESLALQKYSWAQGSLLSAECNDNSCENRIGSPYGRQ